MSRLSIPERRMVAIEMQILKTPIKTLRKRYGRPAVDRWRDVDCCSPDSDFSDVPRSGRPQLFGYPSEFENVSSNKIVYVSHIHMLEQTKSQHRF